MAIIHLDSLQFQYDVAVGFSLNIPEFVLESNQHLFIEGPSGCGKTTFLNVEYYNEYIE